MPHQILLVEDETIMLQLLTRFLEKTGYQVSGATNATEALALFEKKPPSLVLLDLVLPDEDGLVIIRKIRSMSDVPIVVLSARAESSHRIAALELGANDFVNKGVDPHELLLRIANILKGNSGNTPDEPAAVRFAGWTLDVMSRELRDPGGHPVHLTGSELQLLLALAKNPGHAVQRKVLIDAVSRVDDGPTDRNLDTYINRLRKKIEADPKSPQIIVTLRGVGYLLARDEG